MTYDLSGRMLTATRGGWLVTFTYDGANRVTQTMQNGQTINYTYNIPARIETISYPGGRTITESMDLRSRLSQIDDAASPPPIVLYSYDAGNRALLRTYRNGTTAAYTYNNNDWITTLQHSSGVTPIAGFAYTYDNEGNKQFEQKLQDTTHSEAYAYDNIYRLITFEVGTLVGSTIPLPTTQTQYTLDPVGNWPKKVTNGVPETRTHNTVNEITTDTIDGSPTTSLSYDNNGNLTTDSAYTYAYDEENRLVAVTRNSDSVVVGQYQYDALSRRVQKIANTSGTPTTTRYFYDDARIIEEQDPSGATQATYVYGNYVDEVLTMDRGGQTYYYHQNALWSVEAITDSTASVVERDAYDAYGSPTILPSIIGNPYLFTGRQLDAETGDYFYRARYYDPVKGRFLERDPLGYIDGMNLYEYGRSNPQTFTDPKGTDTPDPKKVKALIDDLDNRTSFETRQKASVELELLALYYPQVYDMLKAARGGQALELVQRLEGIISVVDKIEQEVKGGNGIALRERLDRLCDCATVPLMKAQIARILSTVLPVAEGNRSTPLSDIGAAQQAYNAIFCSLTKCTDKLQEIMKNAAGEDKKKCAAEAYKTLLEEAGTIFGASSRRNSLRNYLYDRLFDLKKTDMPAAQYIEDKFRKAVRDCK
jgi:RHS repeat-associated protein